MQAEQSFPCPCCGYLTFSEEPGSYAICDICDWEDDLSQLRFVKMTGANHVNLIEAQKNFAEFGVCERPHADHVRPPETNDRRDEGWRPLNVADDNIEAPIPGVDYGATYPEDATELYYWRENYWRK